MKSDLYITWDLLTTDWSHIASLWVWFGKTGRHKPLLFYVKLEKKINHWDHRMKNVQLETDFAFFPDFRFGIWPVRQRVATLPARSRTNRKLVNSEVICWHHLGQWFLVSVSVLFPLVCRGLTKIHQNEAHVLTYQISCSLHLMKRVQCETKLGRQGGSETLRILTPIVAQTVGDETKPQWKVGCEFSKTVVGKPAKPFDSVDEKYLVPCKPVQREFAVQMTFCAVHCLAWRMNPIHTCWIYLIKEVREWDGGQWDYCYLKTNKSYWGYLNLWLRSSYY